VDAEAKAKKLADLRKALTAAYVLVTAVLSRLPVPMNLPAHTEDPALILRSLDLAWSLAGEEGLTSLTLARVRGMITAWATAYEVTVMADMSGPAPWRLRGIEDALARATADAAVASRHLSGDFSGEQLTAQDREEIAAWARRARRRARQAGKGRYA
jgi:hypothetical protein